jgi:two-component system, chemotaxis family, protein-glutamate methylesterase/glutaminase
MYASAHKPFEVVVAAASAGGIEALREMLAELPGDFPCPIVVAQHLASAALYTSSLDHVLGRCTALTVKWVEDGESLRPGHVYLALQDHHVRVAADGCLRLAGALKGVRPAADVLFRSVATHFGASAAAVVLSGALDDGARGVYEIASAGGRVLVQDWETASMKWMPMAAAETGAPEFALSPRMIGRVLVAWMMAPGAADWLRVWRRGELRAPASGRSV